MTVEKYCDINYRDYLLEIEQNEYVPGKFSYCGKSQDKISFFSGPHENIQKPINRFIFSIDEILGEREKEEEILFCTIIYKGYELEVFLKTEDLSYMAWVKNFDFATWSGTWSIEKLVSVIEAFRKKVDSGTGEDLIQAITDYRGHRLVVRKKKGSSKYIGTSTLLDGKWRGEGWKIEDIVNRYKTSVDRVVMEKEKMLGKTYDTVCEEWGNTCYRYVDYKNFNLTIKVRPQGKDRRALYIGRFSNFSLNYRYKKTFESIHYDKVVSRFQRFVDEYCTDWGVKAILQYKGYEIKISREVGCKDFYFGTVQFHKNSTFKHIADTREEVERCCMNRIDKVIYEKKKETTTFYDEYKGYELVITYEPTIKYPYIGKEPYVGRVPKLLLSWRGKTPEDIKIEFREYFNKKGMGKTVNKEKKIQELEQLQARISAQLEELKKEKDILTYKGVVLEYGKEEWTQEGYLVGRIKDAPDGVDYFYGTSAETIKDKFEEYIDDLEKSATVYQQLMKKYIR